MQRGFALLTVLWALVILSVLALFVADRATLLHRAQQTSWDHLRRKALAEAAAYRAIFSYLVIDDDFREKLISDGRRVAWAFRNETVHLTLEAESGKIDLNAADLNLIRGGVRALYNEPELSLIMTGLERQTTDQKKVRSLALFENPAFVARGGQSASAVFTIFSGRATIDPATASEDALSAVPGLSRELAREVIQARRNGTLPPGLSSFSQYFSRGQQVFTLTAYLGTDHKLLTAVVDLSGHQINPRVLSWRERY